MRLPFRSRILPSTIFAALLTVPAASQSGKAFLKEADKLRAQLEYEQALEKYGFAISIEPKLIKAWQRNRTCPIAESEISL